MTATEASAAATTVALGVGALAKQWQAFPDRFIPTLVAVVGAGVVVLLAGLSGENLVDGLLAGLASTGINQAYRQTQRPE